MKLLLYPHGGSGNHGCEAIVRSTLQLTKAEATLFSENPVEDATYGLGKLCNIQPSQQSLSRHDSVYWKALVQYHLGDKAAFDRACFRGIFKQAKTADLMLSIGGDNYCYGMPTYILLVNKQLRKQGVKTVLWGCSVEPNIMTGAVLDDLKGYTHIVARESITYNALKAKGISQVSLFPDPAFLLKRIDLPLPEGFADGNTVGINVSPMIIGCEKNKGVTLQNYMTLIKHIIDNTDMQVALIPHVVWPHNDDRQPLGILYEKFRHTGRVVMIQDCTAEELKGYIARCRFMIAARTHASIAAYSCQVPTLVVGYSVKARGIAKDIFGTEKSYVVPVQNLEKEDDLSVAFLWLCRKEAEIKDRYQQCLPLYKEKTLLAGKLLQCL